MKMTMHIDEVLLERVMKNHGYESKTEAISESLKEMDRRDRLLSYKNKDMGFTGEEIRNALDPAYDVMAMRYVAEPKVTYGRRAR